MCMNVKAWSDGEKHCKESMAFKILLTITFALYFVYNTVHAEHNNNYDHQT